MIKIVLYIFYGAGSNTAVDDQRKGFVLVFWFDPTTELAKSPFLIQSMIKMDAILAVRIPAIHLCTPDTSTHRVRRLIFVAVFPFRGRTRLKMHVGRLLVAWCLLFRV